MAKKTAKPMDAASLAKATSLYDRLGNHLGNLWERWQNEKDYEDFDEYVESARKVVEKIGGNFVRMTERPFGVVLAIGQYHIRISVTSRQYKWARIK